MKLEFLGTGAADFDISKRNENEEFRRNSSALIDGVLLIDPGPHIFDYADKIGNEKLFKGIKSILVTHSHPDHFSLKTLERLAQQNDFTLYHHERLKFNETYNTIKIKPMDEFSIEDYTIKALPGNHLDYMDTGEICLHYIIEKDGRSLFYGMDSGWLTYPEWMEIKKRRINAFIFEATIGYIETDDRMFGHTNLYMVEMMKKAIQANCAAPDTKFYITHMARTLHPKTQKAVEESMRDKEIIPAFDGLIIYT